MAAYSLVTLGQWVSKAAGKGRAGVEGKVEGVPVTPWCCVFNPRLPATESTVL